MGQRLQKLQRPDCLRPRLFRLSVLRKDIDEQHSRLVNIYLKLLLTRILRQMIFTDLQALTHAAKRLRQLASDLLDVSQILERLGNIAPSLGGALGSDRRPDS